MIINCLRTVAAVNYIIGAALLIYVPFLHGTWTTLVSTEPFHGHGF